MSMNYELEKLAGTLIKTASSEKLQVLAKRAASAFVEKESDSVNDAIKSVIENENLNKNQVQRVSEMTNQAIWKSQFHENGNREDFAPADAAALIESLGEAPVSVPDQTLDYTSDPGEKKQEEYDLEQVFKVEDSTDLPQLDPTSDLVMEQQKVASVKNMAEYSLNTIMRSMEDVSEDFYGHVKQAHMRDEIGILQIAKAISEVTESENFASSIMKTASERLQGEGVRINTQREVSLLKQPVVINSEHPLLFAATKLEKLAKSYKEAFAMYEDAESKERNLTDILKATHK